MELTQFQADLLWQKWFWYATSLGYGFDDAGVWATEECCKVDPRMHIGED